MASPSPTIAAIGSSSAALGRFRNPAWIVVRSGPIGQAGKPRRPMSGTRSGPAATTTSCPARWAARTSGTIGSQWPTSGLVVKSIRVTGSGAA